MPAFYEIVFTIQAFECLLLILQVQSEIYQTLNAPDFFSFLVKRDKQGHPKTDKIEWRTRDGLIDQPYQTEKSRESERPGIGAPKNPKSLC